MAADPDRYFRPPYVGSRGWIGMRLDHDVDWDEVALQCEEAFRSVAPVRLISRLDGRSGSAFRSSPRIGRSAAAIPYRGIEA
jgi:hypothetical protein